MGVGVGDSTGVGVVVDVGVPVPSSVTVTPVVAVGDAVPVCVGVALGRVVALGLAVGLGVGMPVEETMVGPVLRAVGPRPQASRVARRAITPAPVKKFRRLRLGRLVSSGGNERWSVMSPIIKVG